MTGSDRSSPTASGSNGPTERTRRSHAERREEAERRLIDAAVQIVAERGSEALTLGDVGEAAGYSRGLPRHYFGRKTDLLAALAQHIVDGFANRMAQAFKEEPGLEAVLFGVRSYFDGIEQGGTGGRALQIALAEALTEPALNGPMSEATQRSVRRLAKMLRQGMDKENIRGDIDPQAQAIAILATLRGAAALWATDAEGVDVAAMRESYLTSLRRNLAA